MKPKAIFIDIDGTLLDHEAGCIPPTAIEALQKAHQNGHHLFLCTGRGKAEVGDQFDHLPFEGMILSNGANIVINDQTIFSSPIDKEELKNTIRFMLDHQIGFTLDGKEHSFIDPVAIEFFRTMDSLRSNQDSELSRGILNQKFMHPFCEVTEADLDDIVKISIFSENRQGCQELLDQLPDALTGFIHTGMAVHATSGEIYLKHLNKSTGIRKILDAFQIPHQDSIAIGDSRNDLEMIEYAHIGICMGNGDAEVKEKADFVTKDISQDGFAYALKHFHLI